VDRRAKRLPTIAKGRKKKEKKTRIFFPAPRSRLNPEKKEKEKREEIGCGAEGGGGKVSTTSSLMKRGERKEDRILFFRYDRGAKESRGEKSTSTFRTRRRRRGLTTFSPKKKEKGGCRRGEREGRSASQPRGKEHSLRREKTVAYFSLLTCYKKVNRGKSTFSTTE